MLTPLAVQTLGLRPYAEVWALQKELQSKRKEQAIGDTLILCQHSPVITAGTSAKKTNILIDQTELKARGVDFFEIERGGDVTFHGPGQLVAYPIMDLNQKHRDVHWYMRTLEEVILRVLAHFQVAGSRFPGRTGVWIQGADNVIEFGPKPRKIASIGVRISRWCTMHGAALNVTDQSAGFSLIHPCGFQDIEVTSMATERERVGAVAQLDLHEVEAVFASEFAEVFQCLK